MSCDIFLLRFGLCGKRGIDSLTLIVPFCSPQGLLQILLQINSQRLRRKRGEGLATASLRRSLKSLMLKEKFSITLRVFLSFVPTALRK